MTAGMANWFDDLPEEVQDWAKKQTDPLPFLIVAGVFLFKAAEKLNPKSATGFLVHDARDTIERVVEEINQRRRGP
jgi:hypothetical protein